MDIKSDYTTMLMYMRGIFMGMGTTESMIPIIESDRDFINTLSTQAKYDYHFLSAEVFTSTGRPEKAEASLAEVRQLIATKAKFFGEPVSPTKKSLETMDGLEASMRQSAQLRHDGAIAALMAQQGNKTGADSLNSKVILERQEQFSSQVSERVQKKMEKRSSKLSSLFESLYGTPLELFGKNRNANTGTSFFQTTLLTDPEPAGYLNSIPYYIRKKDHAKAEQLITEARARIKQDERRPIAVVLNEGFHSLIDNLEAIHLLSMGSYDKMIVTRAKPMKNLDRSLNDGLAYLSEKDLQAFFENYQTVLSQYLAALSLTGSPEDIIHIFEKSADTRGLLLSVSKARGRVAQETNAVDTKEVLLLKRYRARANVLSQQAHISGNDADLDSLELYESMITKLQRDLQARTGQDTDLLKPISWKQVQAKLKPSECFAFVQLLAREYFDSESQNATRVNSEYWLIFFDHQSTVPKMVKIEDEVKLERGLRFYQNSIKGSIEDKVSYDLFWQPIANLSKGYSRLYFSADGVYHLLNPYTLQNPKTQQFVLDEIEIRRVSQLASLVNNTKKPPFQSHRLAFIGNPDFSMNRLSETSRKGQVVVEDFLFTDSATRSGLVPLPGAEQEVKDAASKAKTQGLESIVLTGQKASEFNVKRIADPEILHFATHDVFVSGNLYDAFLRSKLVLAGVNDGNLFTASDHTKFEDGWLTAYEVTQLRLQNTLLVVLSACETAVGEVKASEGVYGIQRAFELAGARYVMGSLWKIDDLATATLMSMFYDSYFKDHNVMQAYRTAMITTRKQFPHPYYWGGFVLNGVE